MHSQAKFINRALSGQIVLLAIMLTTVACKNDLPTGQVIAEVNNQDVTISEFVYEAQREPASPPPSADLAVVEQIVRRKVFAGIAQERGLEQDPLYHFEFRRAREALLVEALYRDLANEVPTPSEHEITTYVAAHPWLFSERRLLILVAGPEDGEPQTTIDTASFSNAPPFPILQISAGAKMRWQGRVREVVEVQKVQMPESDMRRFAIRRMGAQKVEEKLARMFARAMENGELQYASGYGPSSAQLPTGM